MNKSGIKGVYKYRQKWASQIQFNKQTIHLGLFDTIEEATIARQTKANELFGEFTNSCETIIKE